MPNLPTPFRAALGLAATAIDEARKLPETLPQVPVVAVTTAMQASLRVQQHIAAWAARGDEVLSQLRGTSSDAPPWATFDEEPDGAGRTDARAPFDRIRAGATPVADSLADELANELGEAAADAAADAAIPGRFEVEEVGGTERKADRKPASARMAATRKPAEATAAPKATARKSAKATVAEPADGKMTAGQATSGNATARNATKKRAAKTVSKPPARKAAGKRSEPLDEAARKAKPSDTPNPATMAAEIVHAHEAEATESGSIDE